MDDHPPALGAPLLAELAAVGRVERYPTTRAALDRLACFAVAALPGVTDATINLGGDGSTVAGSSTQAGDLDGGHDDDDSPARQALRTGTTVGCGDLAAEPRWPGWQPRALALGLRSSASIPLTAGGSTPGALTLYAPRAHAFDAGTALLASAVAAHAATVLANLEAYRDAQRLADQLAEALRSRAGIEQAKGALMRHLGVDADTAWNYLVRLSQTTNRKVRDVAAGVVVSATAGTLGTAPRPRPASEPQITPA